MLVINCKCGTEIRFSEKRNSFGKARFDFRPGRVSLCGLCRNKIFMEKLVTTFIVAGAVIKKDGRYLLVQEKNPKVYGLWNWPAGKVEQGDSIEQTAIKEAKEEVGYDVELIRKIDIFQKDANEPPKHAYEARIIGGELKFPEDEILDAKWFTCDEIKAIADKLRGEWIIGAIEELEGMTAR